MSDPITWRRHKSRRKWPSQAVAALSAALLTLTVVVVSAQSFLGGGRSFLRAPLSALGANLLRRARWPANPNRYGSFKILSSVSVDSCLPSSLCDFL